MKWTGSASAAHRFCTGASGLSFRSLPETAIRPRCSLSCSGAELLVEPIGIEPTTS